MYERFDNGYLKAPAGAAANLKKRQAAALFSLALFPPKVDKRS